MEIWEVIKEIAEDTKKRFVSDKGTKAEMIAFSDGDNLRFEYVDGARVRTIALNRKWECEKSPVTWQEAMTLWAYHGKAFYVEVDGVVKLVQANQDYIGT